MYKRKGEKEACRAVSKFTLSHCRKAPLSSLNTLKRDFVLKNMIILFSIANIKYLKGVFFLKINMKASKFSITFGNSSSSCCKHKSLQTEVKQKLLCRSCWPLCSARQGDAPDRQESSLLWEQSEAGPAWGRQSAPGTLEFQCCEFPGSISSLFLPTRAAQSWGSLQGAALMVRSTESSHAGHFS